MTITVYSFENAAGCEDTYVTQDATEAQARAIQYGLRVWANEYEFTDRDIAWDFTGNDSDDDAA